MSSCQDLFVSHRDKLLLPTRASAYGKHHAEVTQLSQCYPVSFKTALPHGILRWTSRRNDCGAATSLFRTPKSKDALQRWAAGIL